MQPALFEVNKFKEKMRESPNLVVMGLPNSALDVGSNYVRESHRSPRLYTPFVGYRKGTYAKKLFFGNRSLLTPTHHTHTNVTRRHIKHALVSPRRPISARHLFFIRPLHPLPQIFATLHQ